MKATIFEIKRFAVHDGDGIRTTVFFKGCPLKCVWCHNPEGISVVPQLAYYEHKCISCGECVPVCTSASHGIDEGTHTFNRDRCTSCGKCADVCFSDALTFYGREVTVSSLLPVLLEDKEFYEGSGGGVTLSGGECLSQSDFCAELLKKLKENGINTAVDTCGFVTKDTLDKVIPYTDVFLYDLKAYDDSVHVKCTGVSNKIILDNLRYLDRLGKKIEIRIPYVPNFNSDQMEKLACFLSELKNVTGIRVLAYHNYASSKYRSLGMKNTLPSDLPTDDELERARKMISSVTGISVTE
jgi:pyruvate formate lyase activating enzyme